jgi:RHS repeat-associated protein
MHNLGKSPSAKLSVRAPAMARRWARVRLHRLSYLLGGDGPENRIVEEIPAEGFGGQRRAVHVLCFILYSYNSQGNTIKMVDERNNATTYSFDSMNRETGMTDPLNDITTYVYDSGGNLIVDEEPTPASQTARTTTYAYDSMNRLTTTTAPLSTVTVNSYDAAGNLISVKDPMGRITTTVFDALNRPVVTIDPMNNRTTTTYDGDSEVIQVVDPMGRITTATYDNRGWVATQTDPLGNVTTYSYTATGMTATVSNPGSGGSDGYVYNADDEEIAYTDPNGHTTSYGYDGAGNQITVTDANNNTTTYAYDSRNQLTTITDPLGDTTVYGYDASGNQQTVTDGLGHTTTTLYDALNRATTIISAVSGTTTITYDAAGRETSLTDPVGNKTQWAYDALDRVTTLTQPNGATVTYVYDADNELTDTTDADGRRTTYSYNADGDQTGERWLSGTVSLDVITYTYDADKEMTGAADNYATLTFTYDSGGNQISAATSGPGTGQPSVLLSYTYNQLHNETSVTDNLSSQGITTYGYDAGQLMTTITTSYGGTAGPQVLINYDPANRITSESRTIGGSGDSVDTTYSYDAANRQTTITDGVYVPGGSGGTLTPLATYVYSYDKANRVTTMVDADGTYTYTYDNADELTNVDKNGTQVESYSYDLNGNRTGTGYSTTVMNETATSPGTTYTYDAAGNMIAAKTGSTITTYTYDYRNRLTEVTQNGTVIASYTYDALNDRIGIQDSGGSRIWTVYDGTNPYADYNSSGTLTERYLFGPGVVNGAAVDEILARTSSGGTTAWYLTDKLGSVRDIVSSSGTELDHIVYDSFGNVLTETNATNGDRFKYAGMEYDSVTDQYYDRARYYDSAVGRFMAEDPAGFRAGDYNLCRYVDNSPTDAVDPSGQTEEEEESQSNDGQLDELLEMRAQAVQDQKMLQNKIREAQAALEMMTEFKDTFGVTNAELVVQQMEVSVLHNQMANAKQKDAALDQAIAQMTLLLRVNVQTALQQHEAAIDEKYIEAGRAALEAQNESLGKMAEMEGKSYELMTQKNKASQMRKYQQQSNYEVTQRYFIQVYLYMQGQGPSPVWPPQNPDPYPYTPGGPRP